MISQMRREFAVSIYLFFVKFIFNFFKKRPLEDKTVFVASFGGNVNATINALENSIDNHQIIILANENYTAYSMNKNNRIILSFNPSRLKDFVTSIYHLATASTIFVDNYYGFLAVTEFKPEVKCAQLWHAAGAIKQFGLEDLSNRERSNKALNRFHAVYNRFDYITVGSVRMMEIFEASFGVPKERFIKTGIPRTDFFFDQQKMREANDIIQRDFPLVKDKKVVLYAPTYRDDEFNATNLQMDLGAMYQNLKHDYILLLRLHPAVNDKFENKYPGFIFNVTTYPNINDLLIGTDILITDYSSIPFEFSLLNRPMIFYAYDFEEYRDKRGVWDNYYTKVPGPVVETTEEIIEVIEDKTFLLERVQPFANEWNKYSNGNSSENLINFLYDDYVIQKVKSI